VSQTPVTTVTGGEVRESKQEEEEVDDDGATTFTVTSSSSSDAKGTEVSRGGSLANQGAKKVLALTHFA
jgi:hypothetical protein